MVHDLEKRVQAAKNNVESMSQLMTKWCEAPLYERKEGKKEGLLNIEVKVMRRHSFEKLRRLRNFMRVLQLLAAWSKCSDEILRRWIWIVGIILLLIISQDSETNLNKRYSLIQQSGEKIHELMKVYFSTSSMLPLNEGKNPAKNTLYCRDAKSYVRVHM